MVFHKIRATQRIPPMVAGIAADAIGGLRSALDLAVCDCKRLAGHTDMRNTYFHFAGSEVEWDKSVGHRTKGVPPQIVGAMRALKPWGGGFDLLYALSKLAVLDKHQLLVPIALNNTAIGFDAIRIKFASMLEIPIPNWDPVKNEGVFLKTGPGSEIEYDGLKFRKFIAFGDVELVAREPVVPILDKLRKLVGEIVGGFEREMLLP